MFKFLTLLRRFITPYKRYIVISLLFNFLSAILGLFSFVAVIPILEILFGIKKVSYHYMEWNLSSEWNTIINSIKNNCFYYIQYVVQHSGASVALLYLGIFLIIATFLKVSTSYLSSHFIIPIRMGIYRDLRSLLYNKIVSLPIGFFSDEKKGDIMARITGDVGEVENSIMGSLDMVFKDPVIIAINLVVMFSMSWKLSMFVLIILPISGLIIGQIGKSLKKTSKESQEQYGELLSQIEETLSGLRIVKAFNAEKHIKSRFEKINEKLKRTNTWIIRRQCMAHPVSEFMGTIVIAILLLFGGSLILDKDSSLNAAEFMYFLVVFYSIINPAKDLSKAAYSIQKGMASLERVDKILNTENNIKDPVNPKNLSEFSSSIEFKNLSFKYETNWVLKNINLTVKKGSTVALVGQSGSGKSTLVDLLPRFYDAVEGEILIDGINIKDCRVYDLRSLMGNVNQEAILFNDTFYNNIVFGVENVTSEQVIEAAKTANAHDFIMATEKGYETNIGDRGNKLSGGQRQRISIARAILKNPPILILDEATSALDTESEKMVQQALDNLKKNRTTLVVAHRLSTIQNADEICVMHEGEIVERGKHDELIALDGYYKRLCDMQSF